MIVKFFDYLTAMKKMKLVASFLGVKKASLETLQSSLSSDLFFILEKNTSNFLAVSGYDRKPLLIGYNQSSAQFIDPKFESFNGLAETITNDMLSFVEFLDISRYKPTIDQFNIHKYSMFINNVEHCLQKNSYVYRNELNNGVIEYYYQEFYMILKNNELMFSNIVPNFSLSIMHKANYQTISKLRSSTQNNNDLDLIYDGITNLVKGQDRDGTQIFHNYAQTIQSMKETYLDRYYHGWQEIGHPQTTEDVQLLKMIAI